MSTKIRQGRKRKTYPASRASAHVKEDEIERCPDGSKQSDQTDDQSQHHARLYNVAQGLCTEEAREGIALHGLEDVVLGAIKDFWVIAALVLDRVCDVFKDADRNDNLAFGALQEVGVEDLLSAGTDVLSRNGSTGGRLVLSVWAGVLGAVDHAAARVLRIKVVATKRLAGRVHAAIVAAQEGRYARVFVVGAGTGQTAVVVVVEDLRTTLAATLFQLWCFC